MSSRVARITERALRAWPLWLAIAAHVFVIRNVFQTNLDVWYSGQRLYFVDASFFNAGQVPYRDFLFEYPPLAMLFFWIPRIAGPTLWLYSQNFQLEIIAADVVILLVLFDWARRRGRNPAMMLAVYTAAFVAIGPIVGRQFDLFPAAFTLIALYTFDTGHRKTSWVFLALGVMTKVYPLLLAPLFALYEWKAGERKRLRDGLIAFVATMLVLVLPSIIASPPSLLSLVAYHGERGIQLESTYSSVLLLLDHLGLAVTNIRSGFGSYNVVGRVPRVFALLSTPVLALLLLWSYALVYRRTSREAPTPSVLAGSSLLVLTMGLLGSKVLSPQYLIWLLPLVPLVEGRREWAVKVIFVITALATYYVIPLHYADLVNYQLRPTLALFARNALLGVLALLMATSLGSGTGYLSPANTHGNSDH